MKAFKNNEKLKKELLKKLRHHTELDTFIQGQWITDEKVEGNGFKGCFYGCTMQNDENPIKLFSEKYSIDLWYCHLTEKIFEGLPNGEYQNFPVESIEIIPTGFDFNKIKSDFHRAVLLKQLEWVTDENVIKVIQKCADLFAVPFDEIDESAAWSARSAESAAWSTESAARSAESAAWSAESAAWSAESAARSAESAAWSAESAAWSAWSARSAKQNHYIWLRDTLFEIIMEEK